MFNSTSDVATWGRGTVSKEKMRKYYMFSRRLFRIRTNYISVAYLGHSTWPATWPCCFFAHLFLILKNLQLPAHQIFLFLHSSSVIYWMLDAKGLVTNTKDGQWGGREEHLATTFLYLYRLSLCWNRRHWSRIKTDAYFKSPERNHSKVCIDITHQSGPTWCSSGIKG